MGKNVLVIWHGALYPSYRKPFWILKEKYGWDISLLTSRSWRQALPKRTKFEPFDQEPIRVYPHPTLFTFHGAIHVQPTFPYVFKKVRPDLVYAIEEPFSFAGWLAVYWCKRNVPNIPVITYSYQNIYKRYPAPFRWIERYVLQHSNRVLVSYSEVGNVLAKKENSCVWDVLPQTVNFERLTYKQPKPNRDYFTLGYVGRLTDEKGLATLLWSLSELDDSVRLRIVGDGPARYRLEVLANELGVYPRIAFLGNQSHEDLNEIYHDFDALVLPSKTTPTWKEQFGRVLIEAMACGVPVIGSDSGAIPEVIGDAGLIFSEKSYVMLSEKILLLQRDEQLRQTLSFRGRVRAEQNFSAEAVAKKLHKHFSEVL